MPLSINASAMTDCTEFQIALASCSTQPDLGKIWGNSFWLLVIISAFLLNIIALELVVP